MTAAKRIPDLTAIAGASTANDDNLVIFDTDANETKRILRSQLAIGMVGDLPYTPSGGISATTVPTAIAELDSEAAKSAALAASSGSSLVGHIASGTGAVAPTVQAKLRETVSVKDFGAVGGASTDDATALQAAINYCVTNSKTLFVNNGVYLLANTILDITGPITIIGESESGAVIRAAKADLSAPDGVSGSTTIFRVLNTVANAEIVFETLTLDGGVVSTYKTLNTLGLSALTGWSATSANQTVKKLQFKNCTVKNCGSEGVTSKNYLYYNSNTDFAKVFALAEYIGCTFESIGFGACNINGSQRIINCRFANLARVEHALHRFDGTLEIIDCVFYNAAKANSQTISVLNEKDPMSGTTADFDARAGTRAIIRGCTFENTFDWIDGWPTKTWLQTIGAKQVGLLVVEDNVFVNCGFGPNSGGAIIAVEQYVDRANICDNTIARNNTFFNAFVKARGASPAANSVIINNNVVVAEYPTTSCELYNVTDRPSPVLFQSKGNIITLPANQAFTSALTTAYGVTLPVRRTFTVRAEIVINVVAPTIIRITNVSSQNLGTVYNATPASTGTIYATATFTTDNISTSQFVSAFLIQSQSDVTNTFTLFFEEI